MTNLWWQAHRLLARGMSGPDVGRLQSALNRAGVSPHLTPNGEFGANTERAVMWFQDLMSLVVDGRVGPVTHAVLFAEPFRFELSPPPLVLQGNRNLCWAAALESVLQFPWPGRPHHTMADLQRIYRSHLGPRGNITVTGFRQAGHDLRFREIMVGMKVRTEYVIRAMQRRFPLLMVDNSTGHDMHTRVVYGVRITQGAIDLLAMDPLKGVSAVPIGNVQHLSRVGFFAPIEATH